MKKYIIYLVILISGLVLGYLFFGTGAGENEKEGTEVAEEHDHQGEIAQMWTCSMHPQIMQPEPGDCPICGMDLIPAAVGEDGLEANEFKMTKNAMALANIRTSVVGEGDGIEGKITLSGKIEVNEDQKAAMPAHFDGRVEKLYVNTLGDKVRMGQIIASVYSPELVVAQQELITAAKLKNSQPQLYNAVRNKFRNWKISEAILDEVESSGKVRTTLPIYSHVTGTVTEIMVEEGAHIMNGMPILKVSNLNSVWAVFDAYESQISNLKEGQRLDISVNALPNENFSGKIAFIDPILNKASRTVEVRVVLNNRNNKLKPGMFVQAEVENLESSAEESLEIPKSAVMWTGERSLVFVKTSPDEPVFEMREIKLGTPMGDTYEVLSGLNGGEEIVTNGTFTVDAAVQLAGKPSMMNPDIGEKKAALNSEERTVLMPVFMNYLELKDALVEDDFQEAKNASEKLHASLEKLEIAALSVQVEAALKLRSPELKAVAAKIVKAGDLESIREVFDELSATMINLATTANPMEGLYIQHCPMANSNKGADWLSLSKEIKNPYYGTAMLTCGEVKKTL